MTLENLKYRTNPMFLRNQFSSESNIFGIPDIPKSELDEKELKDLLLLPFSSVKTDNGSHSDRLVHFFYMITFLNLYRKNPFPNKFSRKKDEKKRRIIYD